MTDFCQTHVKERTLLELKEKLTLLEIKGQADSDMAERIRQELNRRRINPVLELSETRQ